jgi:hypothetical protein
MDLLKDVPINLLEACHCKCNKYQNEISGTIPNCLNNLTAMAQEGDSINDMIFSFDIISTFDETKNSQN